MTMLTRRRLRRSRRSCQEAQEQPGIQTLVGAVLDTTGAAFRYRNNQTDAKYEATRGKEWAVRAHPSARVPASASRLSHSHPPPLRAGAVAQAFLRYANEVGGHTHQWLECWVTQEEGSSRAEHHDEPLQLFVQWLDDQPNMIAGTMERCLRWAQVCHVSFLTLAVVAFAQASLP